MTELHPSGARLNPKLKWETKYSPEFLSDSKLSVIDSWSQYESFVDSCFDLVGIVSSWERSYNVQDYYEDSTIEMYERLIDSKFNSLIERLESLRKEAKENYKEIRQLREESNAT